MERTAGFTRTTYPIGLLESPAYNRDRRGEFSLYGSGELVSLETARAMALETGMNIFVDVVAPKVNCWRRDGENTMTLTYITAEETVIEKYKLEGKLISVEKYDEKGVLVGKYFGK